MSEKQEFQDGGLDTISKLLNDPEHIYSAEFVMRHANHTDNGDGTITFKRPNPYKDCNGR